jgi:hypothetical protein
MEPRATAKPSRALEGEDLKTSHWEDARHWMSTYADLLEFKRRILDRVKRDLAGLQPLARKAARSSFRSSKTRCRATKRDWTSGTGGSGTSMDCGWTPKAA